MFMRVIYHKHLLVDYSMADGLIRPLVLYYMEEVMSSGKTQKIKLENGREIEYILDYKKRKNTYLCIREGKVILKISPYITKTQAESFLMEKSEWILQHLAKDKEKIKNSIKFQVGANITIGGKEYIITAINSDKYFKPYFLQDKIFISLNKNCDNDYIRKQIETAVMEKAEEIIYESFKRLSDITELYPEKVTIKKLNSSWGRCSSNGNVSINMNIVFYDMQCIDYVVIHELCHLKHMNHSKEFWSLVESYCPNWKDLRANLRG